MKTKQKSVRVFEITTDNYDKVVKLIESKYVLLKKYLLLVKTNNEKIRDYFNSKKLEVRFVSNDFVGTNEKLDFVEEIEKPKPINRLALAVCPQDTSHQSISQSP